MLDGVGDEVAARLREPDRVGVDERAAAQRLDRELGAERPRQRPPGLGGVVEQRADVDQLRALARAPAVAGRGEVVERERGAPELEVERRGALLVVERVQAQPRGAQRPAQLVARVGDERRVADEPRLQQRGERAAHGGGGPSEAGEPAHAAASTGPSTRR